MHISYPIYFSSFPTLPQNSPAIQEAADLCKTHTKDVSNITALTIGPPKSVNTLCTTLAMGADKAIHIEIPESAPLPEPLAIAKTLQAVIGCQHQNLKEGEEKIDLVILGKQTIDDDLGVMGQILTGLLGWSQATFASSLSIDLASCTVTVTWEIDGGGQEIKRRLPLVVTMDLRLKKLKFATLPNIMKAKKKVVEKLMPGDLGVDYMPQIEILKVGELPVRVGGGKVGSVDELIAKLKEAGITAAYEDLTSSQLTD